MLQANNFLRENESSTPFEDYSIFMYRQDAPEFGDRVKNLEKKLLNPVSLTAVEVKFRATQPKRKKNTASRVPCNVFRPFVASITQAN